MMVTTSFHRVSAETITLLKADPELMDWLLGYSHDAVSGEKLGFRHGAAPPRLSIETAWDEILILLAGTDSHEAYQALHISLWEEYDGCEEIRLFSPQVVKNGLAALEKLKLNALRREALKRNLRTYDGDPIASLLDYALNYLDCLINFWRDAVRDDEGIISVTG